MKTLQITALLTCSNGAEAVLTRMRDVLDRIEAVENGWPSLDQWQKELPAWFISACATPMSDEEAEAWLKQWRRLPKEEQARANDDLPWSLPDWLYWMEPSQSAWRWESAEQLDASHLKVNLAVDGLPVALGAFTWLAKAAGAQSVLVT